MGLEMSNMIRKHGNHRRLNILTEGWKNRKLEYFPHNINYWTHLGLIVLVKERKCLFLRFGPLEYFGGIPSMQQHKEELSAQHFLLQIKMLA